MTARERYVIGTLRGVPATSVVLIATATPSESGAMITVSCNVEGGRAEIVDLLRACIRSVEKGPEQERFFVGSKAAEIAE